MQITNSSLSQYSFFVLFCLGHRNSDRQLHGPGYLPRPAGGLFSAQGARVHPAGPRSRASFLADVQKLRCALGRTPGKPIANT